MQFLKAIHALQRVLGRDEVAWPWVNTSALGVLGAHAAHGGRAWCTPLRIVRPAADTSQSTQAAHYTKIRAACVHTALISAMNNPQTKAPCAVAALLIENPVAYRPVSGAQKAAPALRPTTAMHARATRRAARRSGGRLRPRWPKSAGCGPSPADGTVRAPPHSPARPCGNAAAASSA